MAEYALSVVVEGVIASAMSLASEPVKSVWGFKEELGKLQVSFTKIQALLHDAERRQVNDESVRIWLQELKDVAYEADNVLDIRNITQSNNGRTRLIEKIKESR